MGRITLHNDSDASATYVSNNFIDNYMISANGEYVKIYLYLLRCMNATDRSFSLSAAADKFEHTEKDVQRALKYWEKMKLLKLEYDGEKQLSGIHFLNSAAPAAQEKLLSAQETLSPAQEKLLSAQETLSSAQETLSSAQETLSPAQKTLSPAQEMLSPALGNTADTELQKREYSAAELAAFQEKSSISELLFVTEHYLKRPLTASDLNTILFWYDELKLSADLIEYLIEYCVGKGHTSIRYMDKVAIAWHKDKVTSVGQAKQASSAFSQLHFSVMRALGISGRNLIASETAYIDKWSKSYGFTPDIISEACRRTITAIHQPSFEYADKILTSWHNQNVHHLSDVANLDSTYQNEKKSAVIANKAAAPNRFHNFNQRTYNDMDKLEQLLLNSQGN